MATKVGPTIPLTCAFSDILLNIAAQGYEWIKVEYSGSGDSGGIDSISLVPTGCIVIEDNEVDEVQPYEHIELEDEFEHKVNNLVIDKLLDDADDWYNNEGGGGTLYINTLDASYHGDHYYNVMEIVTSTLTGKVPDFQ